MHNKNKLHTMQVDVKSLPRSEVAMASDVLYMMEVVQETLLRGHHVSHITTHVQELGDTYWRPP